MGNQATKTETKTVVVQAPEYHKAGFLVSTVTLTIAVTVLLAFIVYKIYLLCKKQLIKEVTKRVDIA